MRAELVRHQDINDVVLNILRQFQLIVRSYFPSSSLILLISLLFLPILFPRDHKSLEDATLRENAMLTFLLYFFYLGNNKHNI